MTTPRELTAALISLPLDQADVYEAHAGDVLRWATRLSGQPNEARDIAQEVFCVVQRRLADFSPQESSLAAWLFRITANVVGTRRRRQRLRAFFFVDDPAPVEAPAPERSPEDHAAAADDVRLVYRVLDSLSETDRRLVVLFELEGYSGDEVAEAMGIRPETVWVRLHRARARFLKALQRLDPEAPR